MHGHHQDDNRDYTNRALDIGPSHHRAPPRCRMSAASELLAADATLRAPTPDHHEEIVDIYDVIATGWRVDVRRTKSRRLRTWSPRGDDREQVVHVHKSIAGNVAKDLRHVASL